MTDSMEGRNLSQNHKSKRDLYCSECDHQFTRSDNLKRHIKNIHGRSSATGDPSIPSSSNLDDEDSEYSSLSLSPEQNGSDSNNYDFCGLEHLGIDMQQGQDHPSSSPMDTTQDSQSLVSPSQARHLPMQARENEQPAEECDWSGPDIFDESFDPDVDQSAHILCCRQCWSKISKESCSQEWIDNILLAAIDRCNAGLVQHLIAAGADVTFSGNEVFWRRGKPDYAYTALHRAVSKVQSNNGHAHVLILQALCKYASLLDQQTKPLDLTALNCNCQFAGPFKSTSVRNLTPSEVEIRYKFISILLQSGADANIPDSEGRLPLHSFLLSSTSDCRLGNPQFAQILQLLINKTSDLNAKTAFGSRPLILAADHCSTAIQPLLASGANSRLQSQDGTIAMHLVHSVPAFRSLLGSWPEAMNCRSLAWGATPLHHAVVRGRSQVVEAMIKTTPTVVHQRTTAYLNGLHLTHRCYSNKASVDIMKLLLLYGCDPNQRDKDGDTVIHMYTRQVPKSFDKRYESDESAAAISSENIKVRLEILISHGAKVNELNAEGHTAIALVLDRIFDLAERMNQRFQFRHEPHLLGGRDEQTRATAPGPCQAGCKVSLDKHMFRIKELSTWLEVARIMIEAGAEVLNEERMELLGKKQSRFNSIVAPLYNYLAGHGAFAHE